MTVACFLETCCHSGDVSSTVLTEEAVQESAGMLLSLRLLDLLQMWMFEGCPVQNMRADVARTCRQVSLSACDNLAELEVHDLGYDSSSSLQFVHPGFTPPLTSSFFASQFRPRMIVCA